MKKLFTLCLFFSSTLCVVAQEKNGRISGTVRDQGGKSLQSVTISLLRAKDSSMVKAAASNKSGQYEIDLIADGQYIVMASSVGFEKSYSKPLSISPANKNVQVENLQMTEASKGLAGVTVTAKKPFIETKIDKTIVNVDASPTSAGATALEVLEKSPGVTVDNDGNISLRGKQGVIVMMDGKQTYLSAADLANLLKNTPASALDQIEIMTNPSARYDASGNSGVINIKTKKGKNAGFNGSIMAGFTTSIYKPR